MKFARLTDQLTGGTEQSYSNAAHTGSYNSKTRSCRFQWRKLQDHESFVLTGFLNLKIIDAYGYFLTNCMMSPPTRSSCQGRTGDALVKGLFWSRFHY